MVHFTSRPRAATGHTLTVDDDGSARRALLRSSVSDYVTPAAGQRGRTSTTEGARHACHGIGLHGLSDGTWIGDSADPPAGLDVSRSLRTSVPGLRAAHRRLRREPVALFESAGPRPAQRRGGAIGVLVPALLARQLQRRPCPDVA